MRVKNASIKAKKDANDKSRKATYDANKENQKIADEVWAKIYYFFDFKYFAKYVPSYIEYIQD
jgi:hypothetical protein